MGKTLAIVTIFIVFLILLIIILVIYRKKRIKNLKNEIARLDKEKNLIESAPVLSELAKIETIIKNDKLEEKYNTWKKRFEDIKLEKIPVINDMIIDLDLFLLEKKYKEYDKVLAKAEIELAIAKKSVDTLLEEIQEINLSEEKYRSIIIKLKTKYRELNSILSEHKSEYEDIAEVIELQFENIEKRFQDFEELMEKNEYSEVVHIVKAIDTMIEHMTIVIAEVPDLVLLAKKMIPKKIEQITETYEDMVSNDYQLDYLNINYNIEEALKNVNQILDRIKVLNLEDCMFELKTMLSYLDSLFNEFEKEKIARKTYEENNAIFVDRLEKFNNIVVDIYNQLDDIKNMYDLTDKDVKIIDEVNLRLTSLKKSYKELIKNKSNKTEPFFKLNKNIESFNSDLSKIEDDLDIALKSLGNMYEDEVRAREQLDEIQELLKQSKTKIRGFKLPIINSNYFVQLSEANEAILEIIKELEKKPIAIKTLNTRVDTARDLIIKLYNTTNEMIKDAYNAETAIVYGNKYRSLNKEVDDGLNYAEMLFYKGNYKKSVDVSIKAIELVETGVKKRLLGQ